MAISAFFKQKKSPLQKAQTAAGLEVFKLADQFAALKPIGMMASSQRAIDLANSSVGNYKPYMDKAAALTDDSAKGVTQDQINGYMNPYLDSVLNFSVRDMEDAAARRREEMRATASRSGNDFASSGGALNRFQVESDLADRGLFRDVGALSASTRAGGFDAASRLATDERNRQAAAAGQYSNLASNLSSMTGGDIGRLAAAGDAEREPEEDKRNLLSNQIGVYNSALGGTQTAVENSKKPNVLSQLAGLAGSIASVALPMMAGPAGMAASGAMGAAGGASKMAGALGPAASSASSIFPTGTGYSDRRLKTNIERIGTHWLGIGLYEWDYLWGEHSSGVMADELKEVMPEAVSNVGGYDMVDYGMIGA